MEKTASTSIDVPLSSLWKAGPERVKKGELFQGRTENPSLASLEDAGEIARGEGREKAVGSSFPEGV
jgi:hypothetical protein